MPKIKITFPDGTIKEFEEGTTPLQIAASIGKRLAADALVAKVNDKLVDLDRPVETDAHLQIFTWDSDEGKKVFRHSTAHILAHAIKRVYPNAKNTIGPALDDGFYYDFDDLPITAQDLEKIENEMHAIVHENHASKRVVLTLDDVKKIFAKNQYKIEMAKEFKDAGYELTAYKHGEDFIDLCEGPHLLNTSRVTAIKLMKLAGAYWRGDAKNKQLTRIYGTSFPTDKELKEYLKRLEEAEKRDHRKLGKELDLFTFSDLIGSGLPLFTPKGTILRDQLTKLSEDLQKAAGFQKVWIPHITKTQAYHVSGHWAKFGKELFLVKSQETSDEFVMKPMNCPHHAQIYASQARSYRDLPIRYYETTTVYRDEKAGELSGLSRVRAVTQDDAHIFCRMDQIEYEFENIMTMIKKMYAILKLEFKCRLSFRDPHQPEKYLGEEKNWENAQKIIENVAKKLTLNYVIAEGEAAFYGPKIDIMVTDSLGRQWQCATQQLDFVQPQRFELTYTDRDSTKKTPVMIHKALLGSIERFLSVYLEHTAGKFPLWLNPEQVRIITIANRFDEYAESVRKKLTKHDIRAIANFEAETLNKKIRDAELSHVNYIIVIGEKEMNNQTINVRTRDNKVLGELKPDEFLKKVLQEIEEWT